MQYRSSTEDSWEKFGEESPGASQVEGGESQAFQPAEVRRRAHWRCVSKVVPAVTSCGDEGR